MPLNPRPDRVFPQPVEAVPYKDLGSFYADSSSRNFSWRAVFGTVIALHSV